METLEISESVARALLTWGFILLIAWALYWWQTKLGNRVTGVSLGVIFVALILQGSQDKLVRMGQIVTSGQASEVQLTDKKTIDETLDARAVVAVRYIACEHHAESNGRMTEAARWANAADTAMRKYYDLCPSAPWCAQTMQGKAVSTMIAELRLSVRNVWKTPNAELAMARKTVVENSKEICANMRKNLPK